MLTDTNEQTEEFTNEILVFQCVKCFSIVGDSTHFVAADTEMKTITLSVVSCVTTTNSTKELATSREGADLGSTYHPFKCANCSVFLGKVYKTTARNLDHIRDHFTFSMENILTYQLGSVGIQSNPTFSEIPTYAEMKKQEQRLLKMQQLCLLFQERISALEAALGKTNDTISSSTTTEEVALKKRKTT